MTEYKFCLGIKFNSDLSMYLFCIYGLYLQILILNKIIRNFSRIFFLEIHLEKSVNNWSHNLRFVKMHMMTTFNLAVNKPRVVVPHHLQQPVIALVRHILVRVCRLDKEMRGGYFGSVFLGNLQNHIKHCGDTQSRSNTFIYICVYLHNKA